jgi:energy-coupling factor transporter ATP-binding protein EcfA2
MLTSIRLHPFQQYQDHTVPLDVITVLVGPNGAGKSTIMRALVWAATNQGTPANYHPWAGPKEARVTVVVDGHTITRTNAKGENTYTHTTPEGVSTTYAAVGKSVPDPITAVLNLTPVSVQRQQDGHLWLFESGGKLALALRSVIDLEVMDNTVTAALGISNKAAGTVTLQEAAVQHTATQVAGFDAELAGAEQLHRVWGQVEQAHLAQGHHEQAQQAAQRHAGAVTQATATQARYDALSAAVGAVAGYGKAAEAELAARLAVEALNAANHTIATSEAFVAVGQKVDTYAQAQQQATRAHELAYTIREAATKAAGKQLYEQALGAVQAWVQTGNTVRAAGQAVDAYAQARSRVAQLQNEHTILREQIAKVPTCPTCQQPTSLQ